MATIKVNADGTVVIGTPEGDVLIALTDEDTVLIGGAGEDVLIGGAGNDILNGGTGNDDLQGLAGDDLLMGGSGDDLLNGNEGDDILIGGSGFDTYAFGLNSGNDFIMGFDLLEDMIDLSAAGISSLDGIVSEDENGNAVIDLGNGNSVTVVGVSAADLVANGEFVFAPSGPEEVFLGIDDTYTDAGDGTDQIIDGDSNGEGLGDTDTFVFGPNMGHDVITDFQQFDITLDNNGQLLIVPGDHLDLRAFGMARLDTFTGDAINEAVAAYDALIDITFLDADGNVLLRSDPMVDDLAVTTIMHLDSDGDGIADSSLTLLGIDFNEMNVLLTGNFLDENGDPGSGV